MSELTQVCETGEKDAIMAVLNKHFYSLGTTRSVFCVTDPQYERDFLPPSRDFRGKGYLHSFLASRRIMNVKNRDEGGGWNYTYTISFDTNFPSYLRRRAHGKSLGDLDEAITECLKFLAPYRSGIDIMPYLFENAERITHLQCGRRSTPTYCSYTLIKTHWQHPGLSNVNCHNRT